MSLYILRKVEEEYNCIERRLSKKCKLKLHEMSPEVRLIDMLYPRLTGNSAGKKIKVYSIFRGSLVVDSEDIITVNVLYLYRERMGEISSFPKLDNWKIVNRW